MSRSDRIWRSTSPDEERSDELKIMSQREKSEHSHLDFNEGTQHEPRLVGNMPAFIFRNFRVDFEGALSLRDLVLY